MIGHEAACGCCQELPGVHRALANSLTELAQARADLRRAIEEREHWRTEAVSLGSQLKEACAERSRLRGRLRGVLAETPENVEHVVRWLTDGHPEIGWAPVAKIALAALRARVGMETP